MSRETRRSLENDGHRTVLWRTEDSVRLQSRTGRDVTALWMDLAVAAMHLPPGVILDGELVVWEQGRLAFERLQQRLARRGSGAAEAARRWPAHYVAFDLVHLGKDLTGWPYERRRAALEALFTDHGLQAPLTLYPSTTDPAVVAGVDGGRDGGAVLQATG
ncbi:hypothetical protein [Streptomyces sp. NPDC007206]|uniref:ATP-dependent DNA ligase n=1 Tax=Streptomyces sp. NPDC007206 TaxID=3154317 RepID=UPI0033FED137